MSDTTDTLIERPADLVQQLTIAPREQDKE
jgi:hypothetical protein